MTLEEARMVAKIASTADGACGCCVGELFKQLQAAFPEFIWTEGDGADWEEANPENEWDILRGTAFDVQPA